MFSKKVDNESGSKALMPVPNKDTTPSIISHDMNILGNLISDGYVDIDGRIEGNVKCVALTVREKGMIKGDIIAEKVKVCGEVSGLIKSRYVHLTCTAKVRGVIMHESLSVDDGAFIDGQCKRMDRKGDTVKKLQEQEEQSRQQHGDVLESLRLIQQDDEKEA